MLKFRSLLLATLALATLALAGCEDTVTDPTNKAGILTGATWRTTKFTVGGTDMTSSAQVTTVFNPTGAYTATNPGGSTDTGSWAFNVDETNLEMTKGGNTINWEILTLSTTSLKLRTGTGSTAMTFEAVPE